MQPTYEELFHIVEQLQQEGKEKDKRIDKLEKQVEKLTNELRKYVNENTSSGSIPPYLKKLEDTVDRYAKADEDDKASPKENVRNARPKHIDRKEHHSLENPTCPDPDCKGHARRRGTSTRKRIVIHLQLPTAETVEHESDIYECKKCGKVFSAPVPNALPRTEFDILTSVFLSYMSIRAKMSVDDMKDMLHLFGMDVSGGSITNSMKRLKEYLGPYYSELEEKVKSADARNKDETSHRHNGKNFWAWVIATKDWAYYTIERRRSHKAAKRMESKNGVDVVDGYSGYNKLECERQRCWAHLLRRAKKPIYQFGEEESFRDYNRFVKKLLLLYHNAKMDGKNKKLTPKLRNRYDDKLWKLLESAPTEGRNITRLTNYIMRFNSEWFTFLQYEGVEPTNNRAERALRPMVIKRRISQQTRGIDNMDSYAMQMSMYMSTRLQGTDYIETLSNALKPPVPSMPYES
jgi:transposase